MIDIKTTNMEISETTREYIEKKVVSVEKFVKADQIERVYATVGKSTNHHKNGDVFFAELLLIVDGKKFVASSEKSDLFMAVDDAHDQLVREITSYKTRAKEVFIRGARSVKKMLKGLSDRNPFTSKKSHRVK